LKTLKYQATFGIILLFFFKKEIKTENVLVFILKNIKIQRSSVKIFQDQIK